MEDIFIKPTTEPKSKPKRKLTEKQLASLAQGREKMRLKREENKKKAGVKAVVKADKETSKALKEHNTIKKKGLKEKRKTLKQINKEKEALHLQKLQKQEKLEENVSSYRTECLSKAKTTAEYREIESVLDGITPDILHDKEKLKSYCKTSMSKYIKQSEKLQTIPESDIKEV